MKRLALLLLVMCGGTAPRATVVEPVVLPNVVAQTTVDAGAPKPPAPMCLAPFQGGTGDAQVDPKPVDPKKMAEAEQLPDVEGLYGRARVYFESQHWDESAKIFREVALDHSETDVGLYAVQLYLESLNVLASRANRKECFDDMAADMPKFLRLYCTGNRAANFVGDCNLFRRIDLDIARARAERDVMLGQQNSDMARVRTGAEGFAEAMKRCVAAQEKSCDEMGYNAAVAFLIANDTQSAERIRAYMSDSKNGMTKSPLLPKLQCRFQDGGTCR